MDFDYSTDTITPDVSSTTITFGGTGSILIPSGTTSNRPGSGLTAGMLRWAADQSSGGVTGAPEIYTGATATWKALQYQSANLDGLTAMATNGIIARTGSGTYSTRTITQPAAGITITNGDGVAGAPTLALANDLSALEGLSSTGIAVRTTTDTWAQRTVTGTSNRISVSNGDGVSGNPTIDLPTTVTLPGQLNFNTTATVASATTADIGAATSNYVSITGTTTITSLGTIAAGAMRIVTFAGALTLTYNATSLILPGGASITTAANDCATFVSLGAGNWICINYSKASGTASSLTVQDEGSTLTTAATSFNFTGTGVTATNTGGAVTVNIPSSSTVSFTATNGGTALSANNLVYIDSSGLVQKADATTEGKEAIGFVASSVSGGATATVYCQGGVMTGLSSLTAGSSYYLSTTAGGMVISGSAPSTVGSGNVLQKIGVALTTTTLLFQPGTPVTL